MNMCVLLTIMQLNHKIFAATVGSVKVFVNLKVYVNIFVKCFSVKI